MVDRRAHRVQAVFYSFLLLSMHTPSTSFRAAVGEFRVQVDASAVSHASANYSPELSGHAFEIKDAVNETPTKGVYSRHGNESELAGRHGNESELAVRRTKSDICDAYFQVCGFIHDFLQRHAGVLNGLFDVYSADVITRHTIQVADWRAGFEFLHLGQLATHFLANFNLWLGTFWTSVRLVHGACEDTIWKCVGIVDVIFLVVSMLFIAIVLFPAFCAAVAGSVLGAGAMAFLGTHLGQLVVAVILLVWRKVMANVCRFIEQGDQFVHYILQAVREEAQDIVLSWQEITGARFRFRTGQLVTVIDRFERRGHAIHNWQFVLLQAITGAPEIIEIITAATRATKESWALAVSGLSLGNFDQFVDQEELIVSQRNRISYPRQYSPGFDNRVRRRSQPKRRPPRATAGSPPHGALPHSVRGEDGI